MSCLKKKIFEIDSELSQTIVVDALRRAMQEVTKENENLKDGKIRTLEQNQESLINHFSDNLISSSIGILINDKRHFIDGLGNEYNSIGVPEEEYKQSLQLLQAFINTVALHSILSLTKKQYTSTNPSMDLKEWLKNLQLKGLSIFNNNSGITLESEKFGDLFDNENNIKLYSITNKEVGDTIYGPINNIVNRNRQSNFELNIFKYLLINKESGTLITNDIDLNLAIKKYKLLLFNKIYSFVFNYENAENHTSDVPDMYNPKTGIITSDYYVTMYKMVKCLLDIRLKKGSISNYIQEEFSPETVSEGIEAINSYVNLRYFDSLLNDAVGKIIRINKPYSVDDESAYDMDVPKYKFGVDHSHLSSGFEKENGRHAIDNTSKLSKLIINQIPIQMNGIESRVNIIAFSRAFSNLLNLQFDTGYKDTTINFINTIKELHTNPSENIRKALSMLFKVKDNNFNKDGYTVTERKALRAYLFDKGFTLYDYNVLEAVYKFVFDDTQKDKNDIIDENSSLYKIYNQKHSHGNTMGTYSLVDCIVGTIDRIHPANYLSTLITKADGFDISIKTRTFSKYDRYTQLNSINGSFINRLVSDRIALNKKYNLTYNEETKTYDITADNKLLISMGFTDKNSISNFFATDYSANKLYKLDGDTRADFSNSDRTALEWFSGKSNDDDRYNYISSLLDFIDSELGTSFNTTHGRLLLDTYMVLFSKPTFERVLKDLLCNSVQAAYINLVYIKYHFTREAKKLEKDDISMEDFLKSNFSSSLYDDNDVVIPNLYQKVISDNNKKYLFNSNFNLYNLNIVSTQKWIDETMLASAILNGDSSKATTTDLSGNKLGNYRTASLAGNLANYLYMSKMENMNPVSPHFQKYATALNIFSKTNGLLIDEVLDSDIKTMTGEVKPIKAMSTPELFYHAIVDKFYGSYYNNDGKLVIQPTTVSDKTALVNYLINGRCKLNSGSELMKSSADTLINEYLNTIHSACALCLKNTLSAYSKVFDMKELNPYNGDWFGFDAYRRENTIKALTTILNELAKYTSKFDLIKLAASKGVELIEDTHYRVDNTKHLTLNETLLNDFLLTKDDLIAKFNQLKVEFVKALANSGVVFHYQDNSFGTKDNNIALNPINRIVEDIMPKDINRWTVSDSKDNSALILGKIIHGGTLKNIYSGSNVSFAEGDTLTLNPVLDKYFYVDNLVSANLRLSLTGFNYSHPNKSKIRGTKDLTDKLLGIVPITEGENLQDELNTVTNIASLTLMKRNVIIPATLNYCSLGLSNGVSPKVKVAIIEDLEKEVYNCKGEVKPDLEGNDGSSFTTAEEAILENYSLLDLAVGLDKKTIWHHMYDEYGCAALMKHASYALTNARMRASVKSSVSLYNMYKKMTDFVWKETVTTPPQFSTILSGIDGLLLYREGIHIFAINNLYQDLIEFNGENRRVWIAKEYDTTTLNKYLTILFFDANSEIRRIRIINNFDVKGTPRDLFNSYIANIKDPNTLTTINDLWTNGSSINSNFKLWLSLGGLYSGSYDARRVFSYNDNSHYATVGYMNHAFKDGKLVYKDTCIGYLTNKSAFKNGIANLNSRANWTNKEELTYMNMDTKGLGVQMDAEHEVADSELTEMSLVISALVANGYYLDNVKDIFTGLSNIIQNTAGLELSIISDYISSTNGDFKDDVKNKLYDVIGRILINNSEANPNLLELSETIINEISKNFHINKGNHNLDTLKIPFSDSNLYNNILPTVIGVLNAKAVKRKYPGSGFVMVPSYGFILTFKFNGKTYMFNDVYNEAHKFVSMWVKNKNEKEFSFNGITYNPNDEIFSDIKSGTYLYNELRESFNNYQQRLVNWYLNFCSPKETYDNRSFVIPDDAFDAEVEDANGIKSWITLSTSKVKDYYLYKFGSLDDIYNKQLAELGMLPYTRFTGKYKVNITQARGLKPSLFTFKYVDGFDRNLTGNIFDLDEVRNAITSGVALDKNTMQTVLNNLAAGNATISGESVHTTDLNYAANECIMSNLFVNTFNSEHKSLRQLIDGGKEGLRPELNSYKPNEVLDESGLAYVKSDGNSAFVTFGDVNVTSKVQLKLVNSYEIDENNRLIVKNNLNRKLYTYAGLKEVTDNSISYNYKTSEFEKTNDDKTVTTLPKSNYIVDGDIIYEICPYVTTYTIHKDRNIFTVYKINELNLKDTIVNDAERSKITGELLSDLYNIGIDNRRRSGSFLGISVFGKNADAFKDYLEHTNFYGTARDYITGIVNGEDLQVLLNREADTIANQRYTSLLSSLDILASRIPAQNLQSFMLMKNVGYCEGTDNKIYVSAWQTWLQGSDYDIDKAYIMCAAFDGAGKYKAWSNLFDFTNINTFKASQLLPIPNNDYSYEIVDGMNNPDLYINEDLENRIKSAYGENGNRVDQIKAVCEVLRLAHTFAKNKISIENIDTEITLKLVTDLNTHESTKLPLMDEEDIYKNTVSSGIMSISSAIKNYALSNTPISVDTIGEASKKSPISNYTNSLSMLNPLTKYVMLELNLVGKNVIGVSAVGAKVYFTLLYYYLNKFNSNDLEFTLFNKNYSRVSAENSEKVHLSGINPEKISEDVARTILKLSDINEASGKELLKSAGYADLEISEILSAATDNAKELILAKINCNSEFAGMYLHLIMLGYNLSDIVRFMTNPSSLAISKLALSNVYNPDVAKLPVYSVIKILDEKLGSNNSSELGKQFKETYDFLKKRVDSIIEDTINQYILKAHPEGILVTKDIKDEAINEFRLDLLEFKEINNDALEISVLGNVFLGLNQGLPTDKITLDKKLAAIKRAILTVEAYDIGLHDDMNVTSIEERINLTRRTPDNPITAEEKRVIIDAKEAGIFMKFDPYKWVYDDDYKELTKKYYDLIKRTHNIFDVIDETPQYHKYIELLRTEVGIDLFTSARSNIMRQSVLLVKDMWAKYGYHKELTPRLNTILSDYIEGLLIRSWLVQPKENITDVISKGITINLKKGSEVFDRFGLRVTIPEDTTMALNNDVNLNSFKLWFETSLFLKLKSGQLKDIIDNANEVSDNKLILHLVYSKDNLMPVIKLDVNLTNIDKSEYVAKEIQSMLYALLDLNESTTNSIGTWTHTNSKGELITTKLSIADGLMLYNMLVNQNKPGINTLTAIFKQYCGPGDSILNDFYKYLGDLDNSVNRQDINLLKLGFNLDDVSLLLAPKVENDASARSGKGLNKTIVKTYSTDEHRYIYKRSGIELTINNILGSNNLGNTDLQNQELLRDYNDFCIFKSPFRSADENKLFLLNSLIDDKGHINTNDKVYTDILPQVIEELYKDGQILYLKDCAA